MVNFLLLLTVKKILIKKLYEEFRRTLSHGIISVTFLCALNLSFAGDLSYPKNALSELYYNLSFQVLSDEYELSTSYDATRNLTADISINIENSIRSDQK